MFLFLSMMPIAGKSLFGLQASLARSLDVFFLAMIS